MFYVIPASSKLNLSTSTVALAAREAVSVTDSLSKARTIAAEIGGRVYDTGLRSQPKEEVFFRGRR